MRQGLDGKDQLILDTDQFTGPNGEAAAINYYTPSNDGRYVAVGISIGGSERRAFTFSTRGPASCFRMQSTGAEFGDVAWLRTAVRSVTAGCKSWAGQSDLDKYLNSTILPAPPWHIRGRRHSDFKNGHSSRVPMTAVDEPFVILSRIRRTFWGGRTWRAVGAHALCRAAGIAGIWGYSVDENLRCGGSDYRGSTSTVPICFLLSHKDAHILRC